MHHQNQYELNIYNVEEHLSCYCYDNDEKTLVEVRKIGQTESENISLFCNEIVFVLKGKLRFTMHGDLKADVSAGHLIFLPANNKIHYKVLARSTILIFRLKDDMRLCHTFNINRLNSNVNTLEKPTTLESLEINTYLKKLAKGLVDTWEDGLKCRFYFQAKITETLIMLRAFYSEEQLFRFFYYYFTPDIEFAEFVQANHLKCATVNDFANALNMTTQQFTRRFNSIFGEAPYGWMQREKAQLIYGEICRCNKSLKEIANEYGFNILSNFNRFCKAAFGMNPREIRKTRK